MSSKNDLLKKLGAMTFASSPKAEAIAPILVAPPKPAPTPPAFREALPNKPATHPEPTRQTISLFETDVANMDSLRTYLQKLGYKNVHASQLFKVAMRHTAATLTPALGNYVAEIRAEDGRSKASLKRKKKHQPQSATLNEA